MIKLILFTFAAALTDSCFRFNDRGCFFGNYCIGSHMSYVIDHEAQCGDHQHKKTNDDTSTHFSLSAVCLYYRLIRQGFQHGGRKLAGLPNGFHQIRVGSLRLIPPKVVNQMMNFGQELFLLFFRARQVPFDFLIVTVQLFF